MIIASLAALYAAVACSSEASEESRPDRSAPCRKLCESLESLWMSCDFQGLENPLAWHVRPGPNCAKGCERPELAAGACANRYDDLLACASDAGLECYAGPSIAWGVVVAGCDQAAFDYCDACGCCTTPPSVPAESATCSKEAPFFFHCGRQSDSPFLFPADPMCFPGCQNIGSDDYCCPESFWNTPCDPTASPKCQEC